MSSSEETYAPYGYCTECGTPLEKGAKFCTNCGHVVSHDTDSSDTDDAVDNVNDNAVDICEDVHEEKTESFEVSDTVKNADVDEASVSKSEKDTDEDKTNEISVEEVIAAEAAAQRSTEETHQIPTVFDLPTVPQSAVMQEEETQRMQPAPSPFAPGNTAELPVSETLKQTAHQGVSYSSENTSSEKQGSTKKIALIVGGVVIAIAVALAMQGR